MSKVYDALKKAEQEKAAGGESQVLAGINGRDNLQAATVQDWRPDDTQQIAEDNPVSEVRDTALLPNTLLERCPHYSWNPNPKTVLFGDGQNHAPGTEEFRTLRSELYLSRKQRTLQKVLIASPLSKEGKSFVAANLARAIVTQPEHRVLLIDADLRVPSLHLALGAPQAPGLADYLRGDADVLAITQRSTLDNFYFIPSGGSASNPSELISNGRLRLLLNLMSGAFDWIFLDSPPVIPVSDAKLLAELTDGVVMTVQAGKTPYDLAKKACQEFGQKRIVGVVLNRSEEMPSYSSYYYYGNGRALTK